MSDGVPQRRHFRRRSRRLRAVGQGWYTFFQPSKTWEQTGELKHASPMQDIPRGRCASVVPVCVFPHCPADGLLCGLCFSASRKSSCLGVQ
jgi:hypothetical protein